MSGIRSIIFTIAMSCACNVQAQEPRPIAQELINAIELRSQSKLSTAWSSNVFRKDSYNQPWVKTDPYLMFLLVQGCSSKIEKEPVPDAVDASDSVGLISWVCIDRPDTRGVSMSPSNAKCEDIGFIMKIGVFSDTKERYLLFYKENAWSKKRCPNQPTAVAPSEGLR